MTEPEERLLDEVIKHCLVYRTGYNINPGGGKGSNFHRIALEKRMASLERQGLVKLGAHKAWWPTPAGSTARGFLA